MVDLEKAISIHEEAVQFTSITHPRHAGHLCGLCVALQEWAVRENDITDIERAIKLYENALGLMDDDNADKPMLHSNFGNALEARFNHLGHLEDIDNAILSKQKAVNFTEYKEFTAGHRVGNRC